MKPRTHNIKTRITLIFCGFALFIVAIFSSFTWALIYLLEDALLNFQLDEKVEHIQTKLLRHSDRQAIDDIVESRFKVYFGSDALPADFAEFQNMASNGNYEFFGKENRHYHIAVRDLPPRDKLIVVYDVTGFLVVRHFRIEILIMMIGGTVFSILVGLAIAVFTGRLAVSPLSKLADWAGSVSFEEPPPKVSGTFEASEIVILAETLEQSLVRIQKFIARERLFNRDVSHELRTPITVIKGVSELIHRSQKNNKPIKHQWLERLSTALENMEFTVEAFLWLSKELPKDTEIRQTAVLPLIEKTVSQYRNLIEKHTIEVKVIENVKNRVIKIPSPVFSIIFGNLLKNALQYTDQGNITIYLDTDAISIQDTGIGMAPNQTEKLKQPWYQGSNSAGFGLGLSIVQRLCTQFGCQLEIESIPKEGTVVRMLSI